MEGGKAAIRKELKALQRTVDTLVDSVGSLSRHVDRLDEENAELAGRVGMLESRARRRTVIDDDEDEDTNFAGFDDIDDL